MSVIPPYLAELPLKNPDLGVFRLAPGQLVRARVSAVTADSVTLDLGYATLKAQFAGTDLVPGQRVTLQVTGVGADSLSLSLLPEAVTVLPTAITNAGQLLASLGFPANDPLALLAQQLQNSPLANGIPAPILASLVLTFGGEAPLLLPAIARLLRGERGTGTVRGGTDEVLGEAGRLGQLTSALKALLDSTEPPAPRDLAQLQAAAQQAQGDPAAVLSVALSALAGHNVRYWEDAETGARVLIDEEPSDAQTAPLSYRVLAQVDLPALGPVNLQCLYAESACLARVTAAASTHATLQPLLSEVEASLRTRLHRPVQIQLTPGAVTAPITHWLEERPWRLRGLAVGQPGHWMDRQA